MTKTSALPEGLSAYIAVTAACWAFMFTDGALRMLVPLRFHTPGFSPVQLAYLLVLYEIAGTVTNLCAGWIAAWFDLTSTLHTGLGIQFIALLALAQLDPKWAIGHSVAYVMVVQSASGVAKDLAKLPPNPPTSTGFRRHAPFCSARGMSGLLWVFRSISMRCFHTARRPASARPSL